MHFFRKVKECIIYCSSAILLFYFRAFQWSPIIYWDLGCSHFTAFQCFPQKIARHRLTTTSSSAESSVPHWHFDIFLSVSSFRSHILSIPQTTAESLPSNITMFFFGYHMYFKVLTWSCNVVFPIILAYIFPFTWMLLSF